MNIVTLGRRTIGEKKPDLYTDCIILEFTETTDNTSRQITANHNNVTTYLQEVIIDGIRYQPQINLYHTFNTGSHKIGWKLKENVHTIYQNLFGQVSGTSVASKDMAKVIIPSHIISIGGAAMRGYPAYAPRGGVVCYAITPPAVGSNGIGLWYISSTNKNYIRVPAESVAAYKVADGWSSYASRIIAI